MKQSILTRIKYLEDQVGDVTNEEQIEFRRLLELCRPMGTAILYVDEVKKFLKDEESPYLQKLFDYLQLEEDRLYAP